MKFLLKFCLVVAVLSTSNCIQEIERDHGNEFLQTLTKNIRHVRSIHQGTVEFESRFGNATILERWQHFERKVKELSNSAVKALLPELMENNGGTQISGQCMREAMLLINGIKRIKPWAIKFIDSSAKMIDGLFEGTLSSLGMYDECLDIEVPGEKAKDKGKTLFTGQYCTVELRLPVPPKRRYYKIGNILPELKNFSKGGTVVSEAAEFAELMSFVSFRVGLCVPSGCKVEDINEITLKIGEFVGLDTRASRCEKKEERVFNTTQISVILVYCLLGLAIAVATLLGLYFYFTGTEAKSTALRVLLCFDFVENFKRLTDTDSSSDTLSCLNGFRFLTMCWIVLGHTYLNINHHIFLGMARAQNLAKDFAFQPIINSMISVDTFYCMSGLLVCYLTVKLVKIQKHPFNLTMYIIHRLWRMMPVYLFVMAIVFIQPHMGSGPIWFDNTNRFYEACRQNWWTNLIFINNFYHSDNMCIPQSWYISSDIQMYIGALVILIPMIRSAKVGLSICIAILLASIVYTGVATMVLNLPYTLSFSRPDPDLLIAYVSVLQFRPFIHVPSYCVGMLAGYILATRPKIKMSKTFIICGWCAAFACGFSAVYGTFEWNKGYDPHVVDGLLFACLQRTLWSAGISWVIVCCSTGNGGIVNHILSWKVFIPLGRLTYSVFLIHPIVQVTTMGNIKTLLQPDNMIAVMLFFNYLCISYLLGFALTISIESPALAFQKLMEKIAKESRVPKEKKDSALNGTLSMTKNGDVASMVPTVTNEEPKGEDNEAAVYKL